MAAFASLQHIFEKPLPESSTLMESLSSWKQRISLKPPEESSVTEIFGELHFKENHHHHHHPESFSSSSSSLFVDLEKPNNKDKINEGSDNNNERNKESPMESYLPNSQRKQYRHNSDISVLSMKTSESLSLCTEGLGFESSDDVEEFKNDDVNFNWKGPGGGNHEERVSIPLPRHKNNTSLEIESICTGEFKKAIRPSPCGEAFPPPISCIGRSGKPWVCFKSYRHDGRFVLKEIRIPTHEFLHAHREGGRLKLQFISCEDEISEDDDDEEEREIREEDDQEGQIIEGNGNNEDGDEHDKRGADEDEFS